MGLLRRIGRDLTPYMRNTIYKSIIAPLFEYCSSVLLSLSGYDLQYLQKLQNQGMRIILRCNKRVRISDMLEALQCMSIKERIEYNVCLLLFKVINGECPEYLTDKIKLARNEQTVNTRNRENIPIVKCKTTEEQKMLFHNGIKMYNNLPKDVKNEKDKYSFKRKLVSVIKERERGSVR